MKKWVADITIKNAKKSKYPRFRHAACIEKGGSIMSSGVNICKPRTPNSSFSVHAEIGPLKRILTILARSKRKETYEIYVARITPEEKTAFSKPCKNCLAALRKSGIIGVIHFTTNTGWETQEI
jgi:tRNA(Arg) A34 adenosine deaminase TadA